MNDLDNYIVNSIEPKPRSDGKCVMCHVNEGAEQHLVNEGGRYVHAKDMQVCKTCTEKISDYDRTYYG